MKKMKLLMLLSMLAVMILPASPAHALGPLDDKLIFGDDFTLVSGDELDGNLIVFGGNVVIEEDAQLHGDLIVFGGTVETNGDVDGDIAIFGGQVILGDQAVVDGDVAVVGGQVDQSPDSIVNGEVVDDVPAPEVYIPNIPDTPGTIREVTVGYNPFSAFFSTLGVSILMALLASVGVLFLQSRLDRVSQAITTQPMMVSSIGLLSIVAIVFMALTIILVPFAVLGAITLSFAWLFGVVALGQEFGARLAKAVQKDWTPIVATAIGTFAVTFLLSSLQSLTDMLPFLGCVSWIIPAVIGLLTIGAVVATRFGSRSVQVMSVPVSPPSAEPPAQV